MVITTCQAVILPAEVRALGITSVPAAVGQLHGKSGSGVAAAQESTFGGTLGRMNVNVVLPHS